MHTLLLWAALQGLGVGPGQEARPDTLAPVADSAALATAYLDEGARELVRLARGHRGGIDASVFRYTATGRQRVSVGVRTLRRDRLVYRRESATLIDWRRDGPSQVEVVGAREAVPVVVAGVRVPGELEDWARSFVPKPGDERLFVNPTGGGFAWHPLAEGGEALYHYATGDTTVLRLPDGRTIRLTELRVTPRERDVRRVIGSFWIEMDNHALVQAVFRPSRDFDLERDLATRDGSDASDVPALFKPVRFDVRYVTVEYGLWEMRWWMPRVMAFDASLQLGPARFPVTLEVVYSDYVVEADRHGLPELPPVTLRLAGDPHARDRVHQPPIRVTVADTAALLASPLLPASAFLSGERLITEGEMRDLLDRLGSLPPPPWQVYRPIVHWPWEVGRGLVRYNRVEGFSAGARLGWDFTRLSLDATARLGTGDRVPGGELGIEVPSLRRDWRVAAYHRLATSNPAMRPLGFQNSLSTLLLGEDEGQYFRATGAEVLVATRARGGRLEARLYGERQAAVAATTDFSLRDLLGGNGAWRPNIAADPADQVGLSLLAGLDRGLDPVGWRFGSWLDLTAETGTFTFVRPGLTAHAGVPLPGRLVGALELGAGATFGAGDGAASPVQSHWFLGGHPTLRGFAGGAVQGPDHLRARIEVGSDRPAARLTLFSDAGWAGRLRDYQARDAALSVGAGVSLLDGLFRLDLARVLRPGDGWRVGLYADALF
jgi:hypothetical protein